MMSLFMASRDGLWGSSWAPEVTPRGDRLSRWAPHMANEEDDPRRCWRSKLSIRNELEVMLGEEFNKEKIWMSDCVLFSLFV